jgi:ATP-dependent RNA helicase DDX24/MAK5
VGGEKDTYLYYFLREFPGRTIVFTNSIDQAKRVAHLLQVTESGEEGRGRLCEE